MTQILYITGAEHGSGKSVIVLAMRVVEADSKINCGRPLSMW